MAPSVPDINTDSRAERFTISLAVVAGRHLASVPEPVLHPCPPTVEPLSDPLPDAVEPGFHGVSTLDPGFHGVPAGPAHPPGFPNPGSVVWSRPRRDYRRYSQGTVCTDGRHISFAGISDGIGNPDSGRPDGPEWSLRGPAPSPGRA